MLKTVYADCEIIDLVQVREKSLSQRMAKKKYSHLVNFNYKFQPGYLYVRVRAIASAVNLNYDGWSRNELRKAYKTFIGKPIFVNHNNYDPSRARGVIVGAVYHDDEDVGWIELLHEIDATVFPKLCEAIRKGEIDATSMGADIGYSICSICGNEAYTPSQFCDHVINKGIWYPVKNASTGDIGYRLAFEDCRDVSFFEDSHVFDPAERTALINEVIEENERVDLREAVKPRGDNLSVPSEVRTLREEKECPECGEPFDGISCETCGYQQPPEELDEPSLELDNDIKTVVEKPEDEEDRESFRHEAKRFREKRVRERSDIVSKSRMERILIKRRARQSRTELVTSQELRIILKPFLRTQAEIMQRIMRLETADPVYEQENLLPPVPDELTDPRDRDVYDTAEGTDVIDVQTPGGIAGEDTDEDALQEILDSVENLDNLPAAALEGVPADDHQDIDEGAIGRPFIEDIWPAESADDVTEDEHPFEPVTLSKRQLAQRLAALYVEHALCEPKERFNQIARFERKSVGALVQEIKTIEKLIGKASDVKTITRKTRVSKRDALHLGSPEGSREASSEIDDATAIFF